MDLNKSKDSFLSLNESQETRLTSASNLQNTSGVNVTRVSNAKKPFGIGNATIQPPNREQESNSASVNHRSGVQVRRVSRVSRLDESTANRSNELQPIDDEPMKAASMAPRKASGITVIKFPHNKNVRAVSVDADSNKLDGQRRYDGVFSTATNKTSQIMVKSSKPTTVNVLNASLNGRPRATSLVCTVSSQSTWSQTATTVFGSPTGASGSTLSLLNSPIGMYYDEPKNTLIVTEYGNKRILQIYLNNSPSVGTVIAGGNGAGCKMNQFTTNIGVGLDSSGQLYVSDAGCNRVIKFPSNSTPTTSGTLVGNISDSQDLCINPSTGDLYVVSYVNNAVYKFVNGSGPPVVAAGGNGYGNALNQLAGPNSVYYDYLYTHSLYVTDNDNQRVMKYPSNSTSATNGTVVAGGKGAGSGANQFNRPRTILVDSQGTLYISDGDNNRVQRWLQNATNGTAIVGGDKAGTSSNQLKFPETILFDRFGNLLVSDRNNNRIQRFKITTC
ncbi:unnamed protein product [Adineta steineri]|uniref:NHL repeat containing protein n=2 Tax=Adineta steineri TaxID=433720 RepID=A0A813T718_9BILA|nr:unnamed protein product [Adineta steineri]